MRFLNFSLINISLGFILGIYVGFYDFLSFLSLFSLGFTLLFCLVVWRWWIQSKLLFLVCSILFFLLLGCLTTKIHFPKYQQNHIIHLQKSNKKSYVITAQVTEVLRANDYNQKYILDYIVIKKQAYKGKILFSVPKEHPTSMKIGDKIILYTTIQDIQQGKNPQGFDYASFLRNRNIYGLIYEDAFITLPEQKFTIRVWASQQRLKINHILDKFGFSERHQAMIQALLLGQKQAIDKDTYSQFADVGVVHILAVSGLHIGILYMILIFVLRPLLFLKHGRYIRVFLILICLWMFAAITGFSPSVLRAVTMFSFLSFGRFFQRKTNSLNMLFLSGVVLLIIKPQFIFEVGFQLSYVAVFSIVTLYPSLEKLYKPRSFILKNIIGTLYISMAAQIGILPLQLFYFHQVSFLFLVGNLLIIPFLGILLSLGILCIVFALIELQVNWVVETYSFILDLLLGYVDWLSRYDSFIFDSIYFTKLMCVSMFVSVLSLIYMSKFFNKKTILFFSLSLCCFLMIYLSELSTISNKSELVIFHQSKNSIIGVKQHNDFKVYSYWKEKIDLKNNFILRNYRLLHHINDIKLMDYQNIFNIKDGKLLIIDSTGVYPEGLKDAHVLLSGSPDIHVEKMIKTIQPKQIIADGNNFKSYVERWQKTSLQYNIPFHSTYKSGYLSFSLP